VILFRFSPTDTISELRSHLEATVREDLESETLVFEPGINIALGDRGSIQWFSDDPTGNEGCVLFFIKQKAFVTLLVYGSTERMVAVDVQDLARIIEARIH
jgi:hypothetical protein